MRSLTEILAHPSSPPSVSEHWLETPVPVAFKTRCGASLGALLLGCTVLRTSARPEIRLRLEVEASVVWMMQRRLRFEIEGDARVLQGSEPLRSARMARIDLTLASDVASYFGRATPGAVIDALQLGGPKHILRSTWRWHLLGAVLHDESGRLRLRARLLKRRPWSPEHSAGRARRARRAGAPLLDHPVGTRGVLEEAATLDAPGGHLGLLLAGQG